LTEIGGSPVGRRHLARHRELCLARKTVDTHLHRINRKLGLHDRAQLVRLAAGIGLVHSIRASGSWSG
jgi:hypothetical protein